MGNPQDACTRGIDSVRQMFKAIENIIEYLRIPNSQLLVKMRSQDYLRQCGGRTNKRSKRAAVKIRENHMLQFGRLFFWK